MELEGGSLNESQRLHVQDLGWSSAGTLTASAVLLGHDLRCEAKRGKSLFFVSFRVLTYPQSILEVLFLYLVLTLKSSDTLR